MKERNGLISQQGIEALDGEKSFVCDATGPGVASKGRTENRENCAGNRSALCGTECLSALESQNNAVAGQKVSLTSEAAVRMAEYALARTREFGNSRGSESSKAIVPQECNQAMTHDLIEADEMDVEIVFYISDIHICHQIDIEGKALDEICGTIDLKVKELVDSLYGESGTIIVAGDIADSLEIARIFWISLINEIENRGYRLGLRHRTGRGWNIIVLAGNHELWDNDFDRLVSSRSVDAIIDEYRDMFWRKQGVYFLQNDLLMNYKNQDVKIVDEKTLLDFDDGELRQLLESATLIVLGGIGFAGLNPRFNASAGVYGHRAMEDGTLVARLTRDEEICQSARFEKLHEKMLRCASDKQVIVATHMPMSDWSSGQYNPNWVYISGHTHQNRFVREKDGVTVLSDNQVGYEPKEWHFNSFTRKGRFDPFLAREDGIYDITLEEYMDFNRGRGIHVSSCKWPGQIRVVKRADTYMFFLQGKNLSILSGGQRRKAAHSIEYYFDNLPFYQQRVKEAMGPYHQALETLSSEIKAFGGIGTIHGCIVDIDWWKHVYLNPYDGKITPYYAINMMYKWLYDDVPSLLEDNPNLFFPEESMSMVKGFQEAQAAGKLPVLSAQAGGDELALATVPGLVLDRDMYEPSRIMRSIQYIFDQDVVRIWNDDVFGENVPEDRHLPAKEKPRPIRRQAKVIPQKPKRPTKDELRIERAKKYAEKVSLRSDRKIEIDESSYTGARENVTALCKVCGHAWTTRADHLITRLYCPECRRSQRKAMAGKQ